MNVKTFTFTEESVLFTLPYVIIHVYKCIQLYVYDLFMKHFKSLTLSFLLMSIKDMWRLKVMTNDRIPKGPVCRI